MCKFLAALLAFVLLCVPALANSSDYIQYGDTDEVVGELDPETLCALMGVYIDAYEDYYLVWIPMHGGTRYHCDDECSNMDDPRLVPWECADLLGFTPCKRCY